MALKNWIGSTSNNWNVSSNWSPAQVPISGDEVSIDSGDPFITQTAVAASLKIGASATLTISQNQPSGSGTLTVSGPINNAGEIKLSGTAFNSNLHFTAASVLTGGGKITLSDSDSNFIQAGPQAVTWTNEDNVISGAGHLGNSSALSIINGASGVINATGADNQLVLSLASPAKVINSGLIVDTGSAGLLIFRTTVDSSSGGTIKADGASAHIDLKGATLIGGTLATEGGGIINVLDASQLNIIADLTIDGNLLITDGSALTMRGTITNDGVIGLAASAQFTRLMVDVAGSVLTGEGSLELSDSQRNIVFGASNSAAFTNDGAISGAGAFTGMVLSNDGSIAAIYSDHKLTLTTGHTVMNDGRLVADGGILVINDAVQGGGVQAIRGGGTLELNATSQVDTSFFGSGILNLGVAYSQTISGFSLGDGINLTYITSNNFGSSPSNIYAIWTDAGTGGGTLAVIDPLQGMSPIATLNLAGVYSTADFAVINDGHAHPLVVVSTINIAPDISAGEGTVITDPVPEGTKVYFPLNGGATLEISSPATFKGSIEGFGNDDTLELGGVAYVDAATIEDELVLLKFDGETDNIEFTPVGFTEIVSTAGSLQGGTKITTAASAGITSTIYHTGILLDAAKLQLVDNAIAGAIAEYAKVLGGTAHLNVQLFVTSNSDVTFGSDVAAAVTPVFVPLGKDAQTGRTIYQGSAAWKLGHNGADPWQQEGAFVDHSAPLVLDAHGKKPDVIIVLNSDKLDKIDLNPNPNPASGKVLISNLMLHEFGHAFGFETFRNGDGTLINVKPERNKETVLDSLIDKFGEFHTTEVSAPINFKTGAHLEPKGSGDAFSDGVDDVMNSGGTDYLLNRRKLDLTPTDIAILRALDPPVHDVILIPAGTTFNLTNSAFAGNLVGFLPSAGAVSSLKLGVPLTGTIIGIESGDRINLAYLTSTNFGSGAGNIHATWTANASDIGGTLAIVDPVVGSTPIAELSFSRFVSTAKFVVSNDGNSHPVVTAYFPLTFIPTAADQTFNGNFVTNDGVDYSQVLTGITVDLALAGAQAVGTNMGLDTFILIENLIGSSLPDSFAGNASNNTLLGNGGSDVLLGEGGDDILDGGDDSDSMSGNVGFDTISGGAGNDMIAGGEQGDLLYGGDGNDSINGGMGRDTIDGGTGNDTIIGGIGNDAIFGNANFDDIHGSDGDDTINGGDQGDVIGGDVGDDLIGGGMGLDTIDGGAGNDTITGGMGNDQLTGGADADTFTFGSPGVANDGVDTILDFVSGTDSIQILAAGYGGGLIANGAVTLVAAASAASANSGAGGYFILDNSGADIGTLYWDVNGGIGADAVVIAVLTGVTSLQASDFHVI